SSTTDPRYALKNIVRGDFDAWFAAGADAARAFGKPFYLRFAPEMNGRWGPNVFGGSAVDFTPYYPGSDVVDVLALDGYNWGSLDVWQTYSQVFGPSYDVLAGLDATKPVMIAETASTESGGNKAAWI